MRASSYLFAAGVVAAGVCAAWPFRQAQRLPSRPPGTVIALDLGLRGQDVTLEPSPPGAASPAVGLDEAALTERPDFQPASLSIPRPDLAKLAPAPEMPLAFAGGAESAPQPWPGAAARPQPRNYRLRDGDTLEWIAERFLGSRERAGELFAANQDVLARPDLLPVGTTIKLPPREY